MGFAICPFPRKHLPEQRFCLQQWPVASRGDGEMLQEATRLQQELRLQFDRLSSILTRRTSGRGRIKLKAERPPGRVGTPRPTSAQPQKGNQTVTREFPVQRKATTGYEQHNLPVLALNVLQTTQPQSVKTTGGVQPESSSGREGKAGWFSCCSEGQAPTSEFLDDSSAAGVHRGGDLAHSQQSVAGGIDLRAGSAASESSKHYRPQQLKPIYAKVNTTSLFLDPTQQTSFSTFREAEKRELGTGSHPQQRNQRSWQPCCLARLCGAQRATTSHTQPPDWPAANVLEKKLPIANVATALEGAASSSSPKKLVEGRSTLHPSDHCTATEARFGSGPSFPKLAKRQKNSQWCYGGGALLQRRPSSCLDAVCVRQQLQGPHLYPAQLQLNFVAPQSVQGLLQQQWAGQCLIWPSHCVHQRPLQHLAKQHSALQHVHTEWNASSYLPQGTAHYSSYVQLPWGVVTAHRGQVWKPWYYNIFAGKFPAGRQGYGLRGTRTPPLRTSELLPVVPQEMRFSSSNY